MPVPETRLSRRRIRRRTFLDQRVSCGAKHQVAGKAPAPNSGVLVLPIRMPPLSRFRRWSPGLGQARYLQTAEPIVVRTPPVFSRSLEPKGIHVASRAVRRPGPVSLQPWPRAGPVITSGDNRVHCWFTDSMRVMQASNSSTGDFFVRCAGAPLWRRSQSWSCCEFLQIRHGSFQTRCLQILFPRPLRCEATRRHRAACQPIARQRGGPSGQGRKEVLAPCRSASVPI